MFDSEDRVRFFAVTYLRSSRVPESGVAHIIFTLLEKSGMNDTRQWKIFSFLD